MHTLSRSARGTGRGGGRRRSRERPPPRVNFVFAPLPRLPRLPPHSDQLPHSSSGAGELQQTCTGISESYLPGQRAASWSRAAPPPPLIRLYQRPRPCCGTGATARPWTGTTTRTFSPWWKASSTRAPLLWRTSWWRT